MVQSYYSIPFQPDKILKRKQHPSCNLKESIAHHVHLINTTSFGECIFDETFGCSIWLIDFDNLKSTNRLKSNIVESLYNSLNLHEKRLTDLDININIKQQELTASRESVRIKKRVDINIKAKVLKTNDSFSYVEYFYIGPLSY